MTPTRPHATCVSVLAPALFVHENRQHSQTAILLSPGCCLRRRHTVLADNLKALSFKRTSMTNGKVRRIREGPRHAHRICKRQNSGREELAAVAATEAPVRSADIASRGLVQCKWCEKPKKAHFKINGLFCQHARRHAPRTPARTHVRRSQRYFRRLTFETASTGPQLADN
jgi:hypothetical protein